jgi:hypothetical protein
VRRELALRLLGRVMTWDQGDAQEEFQRLSLLERFKYDSYAEFVAGSRFIESLARWLQQFTPADRSAAYDFVKRRMLFITNAEIERLVEAFFPQIVYYDVLDVCKESLGVESFEVFRHLAGQKMFTREVRQSLFIGVSDGARTDVLRRFNVGRLVNDQVLLTPDLADGRWEDALKELRRATDDAALKFKRVYLLDDFTASGTTFCQKKEKWKGKLPRFYDSFSKAVALGAIDPTASIFVHHYIGSEKARDDLTKRIAQAKTEDGNNGWFEGAVRLSFGEMLDAAIPLSSPRDDAFIDICKRYYDKGIEKPDHDQIDLELGYKNARLPLVLQHNTPNNTVPIIWKESAGSDGHAMRALFRRRERH